jgi:predicted DNA-binding protein with PD1-like motif
MTDHNVYTFELGLGQEVMTSLHTLSRRTDIESCAIVAIGKDGRNYGVNYLFDKSDPAVRERLLSLLKGVL